MSIGRRARAICLLLLVLAVADCSRYAATHVARGDAYFGRQSYGEAIDEYTKAVRFQPDDPHIIRQLGFAHKALGHRPDAYAFLQKVARARSGRHRRRRHTRQYVPGRRSGRSSDERGVSGAESSAEEPRGARIFSDRRSSPSAILPRPWRHFARFSDLAPRDARAHYLVGLALLAQTNVTEATRSFEAALSLSPSYVDPLAQLVRIDLASKRPDAAAARVQKQIAIAGDSAKLHELLGTVYLARGERARADAAFRKAIALSPRSADSFARLSDLDLAAGKYDLALAIAESSLKVDPKNMKARLTQGVAYEQKGDKKRAKDAYEAALAVNPRYSDAANNLAMLLVNEDSTSGRALELAEMAKAASPDDPRISDTLGWVLYKRGDYKRAVGLFAEAAAKMPDEPTVEYHLGIARLKAGDAAGARDALNRALNSRSAFP